MNNQDLYKVVAFQVAQTKNGKEMWRITMCKDGNEDKPLTGVIWQEDIPRFDGAKFKTGNIIKFLGQDYNSNYNSAVIKSVTVVKEALPGLPENLAKVYYKELVDYLSNVSKAHEYKGPEHSLSKQIRKEMSNPQFMTTPAAEKMHHNYIGGLLKHTYEVYTIVNKLIEMFPIENPDSLRMAAIAHDLGKMYEYETDLKLGTATINKEWLNIEISHLHWGFRMAHDTGMFDVARMIASHHGRVEWGALFEPETPEEKLLHLADMISAVTGITTIDKLEATLEATLSELKDKIAKVSDEKIESEEKTDACKNDSDIL